MTRNSDGDDDGSAGRQTTLSDLETGDKATFDHVPADDSDSLMDTYTGEVTANFGDVVVVDDNILVTHLSIEEINGDLIGGGPQVKSVE